MLSRLLAATVKIKLNIWSLQQFCTPVTWRNRGDCKGQSSFC